MVDKSLIYWQKRVYQLVFLILSLILLVFAVKVGSMFSGLVLSFVIAILISYLLGKPVNFMTRFIKVRGLSILIIYSLFITLLAWLGSWLFPIIVKEIKGLKSLLPSIQMKVTEGLVFFDQFLSNYNIHLPIQDIKSDTMFRELAQRITSLNYTDFGSFLGSFIIDSVTFFVYFILIAIFSFYLLLDGKQIWETVTAVLSKTQVEHISEIKLRVDKIMNGYIFGQFQIALLTTTVMILTYLILKVPNGFLLGSIQLLEIIPVLGTWIAIVPAIITIAIIKNPFTALLAFAVYLGYTQIIRDYLLAPRIMGEVLGFHPIGVMFAVIIGAKLGGLAGIIIALPIVASMNEIFGYFVELGKLRKESFLQDDF